MRPRNSTSLLFPTSRILPQRLCPRDVTYGSASFLLSSPDGAKAPMGELRIRPCCPLLPRTLSRPSQVLGKHLGMKSPLPPGEASRGLWLTHISQCLATVWLPKALKVNVLVHQTAHCTNIPRAAALSTMCHSPVQSYLLYMCRSLKGPELVSCNLLPGGCLAGKQHPALPEPGLYPLP